MNADAFSVFLGGAIGLATAIVVAIIGHIFEGLRMAARRKQELEDKKRELQLAILKEKYEPAISLVTNAVRVVEMAPNPQAAFEELETLKSQQSYFVVWAKSTDTRLFDCISMVISYHRIRENEEQWQKYKTDLILAASSLNIMYNKDRESLFDKRALSPDSD